METRGFFTLENRKFKIGQLVKFKHFFYPKSIGIILFIRTYPYNTKYKWVTLFINERIIRDIHDSNIKDI